MLSEKEAFKVSFLHKCASAGLTMEETLDRLTLLNEKLAGIIGDAYGVGKDLLGQVTGAGGAAAGAAGKALPWLAAGAIAAPVALGAGAGYIGSKMTDLHDEDASEVKVRELIDEYNRSAYQAKLRKAMKTPDPSRGRGRPIL